MGRFVPNHKLQYENTDKPSLGTGAECSSTVLHLLQIAQFTKQICNIVELLQDTTMPKSNLSAVFAYCFGYLGARINYKAAH